MASYYRGPRRPTEHQTSWLRRIASSPLIVTKVPGEHDTFSLQNGDPVPSNIAKTLIKNSWVIQEQDGMFDQTQTYLAIVPWSAPHD